MNFIRLTDHNENIIRVNFERIDLYILSKSLDGGSSLYTRGIAIYVKETPVEIDLLIEESNNG